MTEEIEAHLDDDRRGERLRSGVHIVIVGSPNVGKSTLLNYICQRPLAIVSPIPGTTRDVVEGCINFGGYPIVISDTAGLRDSDDAIEHEGIKRALEKARQADLLIVMTDASSLQQQELQSSSVPKVAETLLKDLGFTNVFKPVTQPEISNDDSSGVRKLMMVVNKMDVVNEPWPAWIAKPNGSPKVNAISCLTGFGLKDFSEQLKTEVAELCARLTSEAPSLTQARHRHHLQRCVSSLRSYLEEDHGSDLLLAAHELRRGADQLGKISGDITSEQILDVIFRDFCIGK